jgi:hypothetical protein
MTSPNTRLGLAVLPCREDKTPTRRLDGRRKRSSSCSDVHLGEAKIAAGMLSVESRRIGAQFLISATSIHLIGPRAGADVS